MDILNASFMLDLSYRLTVAVNIAGGRLEPTPWLTAWHDDLLRCAEAWAEHLSSRIVEQEYEERHRSFTQTVVEIIDGLSPGYVRLSGNPHLPFHEVFVYKQMFNRLHKLAHAPVFSDLGMSTLFMLGVQLALIDLMSVDKYAEFRIAETVSQSGKTKFENVNIELPDNAFPDSVSGEFRMGIVNLFNHRNLFVDKPDSFALGGWIQLFLALWNPDRHPSILWATQNKDLSKQTSIIVAAGRTSIHPVVIHAKNVNDQALFKLTVQMKQDKEAGLPPSECGWLPCRDGLWASHERSTLEVARRKLTALSVPLGQLDYVDGRKTNLPHSGHLRLPEVWAAPENVIRISTIKGQKV